MEKAINHKLQIYFFAAIFIVMTVLVLGLLRPFLAVITIAMTLAVMVYPWYERTVKLMRGYRGLAAALVIAMMLAVIIIPLSIMGRQIFIETTALYHYLSGITIFELPELPEVIDRPLKTFAPDYNLEVDAIVRTSVDWLRSNLGIIFSSTLQGLVGLFLTFVALYFLLKDGEHLKNRIITLSPLEDKYDRAIFEQLHQMVKAVVVGTMSIALIQGILVSFGFLVFGIPNFMLWGLLAAFCALIPALGTSLVAVPAVIYLFLSGNTPMAIGLAIWSAVLVGLVDNLLAPYFFSRGNHAHPLMILFAVLGGLLMYGPIGFLLGPIILSVFLALVKIYELMVKSPA